MTSAGERPPRAGEFFAAAPLAAVALTVVNDAWLKARFHSALTGKLSDVAICFFLPLFFSELLGIFFGVRPRVRLALGASLAAALFAALEVVPPFTRLTLEILGALGPRLGLGRRFGMTSDWTDLCCLVLVPVAFWYGRRRLEPRVSPAPAP